MNYNPTTFHFGPSIKLCHINIEGSSSEKSEFLSRFGIENNITVIAVQETHINDPADYHTRGRVPGYEVASYVASPIYGIATYVRSNSPMFTVHHASQEGNIFQIVIEISGMKIINVYKPPTQPWPRNVLRHEDHPAVYLGDFNSHHTVWGYEINDNNGIELLNWSDANNLFLVHDLKDLPTFHSARWQRGYNPDLCFVTRDALDKPMKTTRSVVKAFPRSQHRAVIITIGTQVIAVNSIPKPRWNFRKANWEGFSRQIDASIRFIPNEIENFERFVGIVKGAAKKFIPRGYRKRYIPGWTEEMESLYRQFEEDGEEEISDHLLELLDAARRTKWQETTENMNFTHSSREAWAILRHLGEASKPVKIKSSMDPEKIASAIVDNSKAVPANKHQNRRMKANLRRIKKSLPAVSEFDRPYDIDELLTAIAAMKIGKAAGLDGFYPEFLRHLGNRAKYWLLKFLNKIFKFSKLPPLMMKSKIIGILKPGKSSDDPKNYRPIALLSVIYKLLERLIYGRIKSKIEASLPPEFAGFREKRSCSEQVLAMTSHIEAGFQRGLKTALVLVDLSSAYDTVWRTGFLWKFYKVIPSRKIGRLVNAMLTNRIFRVFINDKSSRPRRLNDGFAQGSVCAPPYFNLYTSDMPVTSSRKFGYADDLGMTIQVIRFEVAEQILQRDLYKMKRYYVQWRLKLNDQKTEVAIFHLNNQQTGRQLNVFVDGVRLNHSCVPKYLGIPLDRSLTFREHLTKLSQKVKTRNNLIQKLSGTSWGANGNVLRTAVLSLVYSCAEYCAPAWYMSRHVDKLDVQLNSSMRIVTGSVDSTPIPWLHVLSHIAPPELRRKMAAHREWIKCFDSSREYELPLKSDLADPPPRRLSSRSPIWTDTEIQNEVFDIAAAWKCYWDRNPYFTNKHLIDSPGEKLDGFDLPRREWKILNRFRSGHGCCNEQMYRWNFLDSPLCDCDNGVNQSMNHVLNYCPLRRFEHGLVSLHQATPESIEWLKNLDIEI